MRLLKTELEPVKAPRAPPLPALAHSRVTLLRSACGLLAARLARSELKNINYVAWQ